MKNYTKEDYERIGRAIVGRLEKSKLDNYHPPPTDLREMVRPGPGNGTSITISSKTHCPGCGLRMTLDARDGALEIGFEPDPLSLLGR